MKKPRYRRPRQQRESRPKRHFQHRPILPWLRPLPCRRRPCRRRRTSRDSPEVWPAVLCRRLPHAMCRRSARTSRERAPTGRSGRWVGLSWPPPPPPLPLPLRLPPLSPLLPQPRGGRSGYHARRSRSRHNSAGNRVRTGNGGRPATEAEKRASVRNWATTSRAIAAGTAGPITSACLRPASSMTSGTKVRGKTDAETVRGDQGQVPEKGGRRRPAKTKAAKVENSLRRKEGKPPMGRTRRSRGSVCANP